MHLENGVITADDIEEELFLAQARVFGADPSNYYPQMPSVPHGERAAAIVQLEDGERSGDSAVVRGLARMATSSRRGQLKAIMWLTKIAEDATRDR